MFGMQIKINFFELSQVSVKKSQFQRCTTHSPLTSCGKWLCLQTSENVDILGKTTIEFIILFKLHFKNGVKTDGSGQDAKFINKLDIFTQI